jgi:transcriptional regulator with XRE-family HTH domain
MSREGPRRPQSVALQFGHNLRRCRRRASFSQEELAARASVHRTAVGMLEEGDRLARVDTMVKLAGALSVSPLELLEGIQWTPRDASGGRFVVKGRASR